MGKITRSKLIALTLLAIHIIFVFALNTFPFQDLPQHLTYAKIIKDFSSVSIFGDFYQFSEHFNSYHIPYYLLYALQFIFSPIISFKILFLSYTALLVFAIYRTRKMIHKEMGFEVPIILAILLSWNGIFFMGFLQYALTLPLILLAFSSLDNYLHNQCRQGLIQYFIFLFLISCMHVFATATLLIISLIMLTIKKEWKLIAINTSTSLLFLLFFGGFLNSGSSLSKIKTTNLIGGTFGLEFINSIFDLKWSNLPTILNYLFWNIIGPAQLYWFLIGILVLIIVIAYNRLTLLNERPDLKKALLYLLLISCLLPWALYRPTEISFINFRFMGIIVAIFFICLQKDFYLTFNRKNLFPLLIIYKFVIIFYILFSFHQTTSGFFSLIKKIPMGKVLHSVVYTNQTNYIAKMFRVQHFLPMYYTILRNGITTQFWAGYTSHLPIQYREGKRPPTAPDWHPSKTIEDDIRRYHYHLIRKPRNLFKSNFMRVEKILHEEFRVLGKHQDWTAYEKK